MFEFLRKQLVFFIIFFVIIFIVSYRYKKNLGEVELEKNITTIICGDSHTQSAINDSILPQSINISQTSEHYFYSYNVLKLLVEKNPHITTIIIGCSFHSFTDSYDAFLYSKMRSIKMYERYFSILDNESKVLIIIKNFSGYLKSLPGVLKNIFDHALTRSNNYSNYSFCGNFYRSERSNLNDSTVNVAIMRHYYNEDLDHMQSFSSYQLTYLTKIIDFANKHRIKLILVNTPIHNEYFDRVPQKFIVNYYENIDLFRGESEFLDYHMVELYDNCFGDGDHLNCIGAEIFTNEIKSNFRIK